MRKSLVERIADHERSVDVKVFPEACVSISNAQLRARHLIEKAKSCRLIVQCESIEKITRGAKYAYIRLKAILQHRIGRKPTAVARLKDELTRDIPINPS